MRISTYITIINTGLQVSGIQLKWVQRRYSYQIYFIVYAKAGIPNLHTVTLAKI